MILRWGSYSHDSAEVWFTIRLRPLYSQIQERRGTRITWVIVGVKQAASKSALTAALSNLESAYSQNFRDLIFYDSDGQTLTAHSIYNSNTFGGTRVVDFRYLTGVRQSWGVGTEYVNKRTFQVTVEADVHFPTGILSWSETVMQIGTGGPEWDLMESLTGAPQLQIFKQLTKYRAVQFGQATGDQSHPIAPAPIWPEFEHGTKRRITLSTPEQIVTGNASSYRTSWSYQFTSANALAGVPGLP